MSHKIVLSADSTCDLSPDLKERYDVHYYPFHIIFRGVDYLDNVTITPDVLHAGYREDGSLPQTAAINEAEYLAYFQPFVDEGYEVVHFNLGAAISTAHEHCALAAEKLPGVYAIDSRNLSTGIALQIIRAGDMIAEGYSAEEIVAEVKAMRACTARSSSIRSISWRQGDVVPACWPMRRTCSRSSPRSSCTTRTAP